MNSCMNWNVLQWNCSVWSAKNSRPVFIRMSTRKCKYPQHRRPCWNMFKEHFLIKRVQVFIQKLCNFSFESSVRFPLFFTVLVIYKMYWSTHLLQFSLQSSDVYVLIKNKQKVYSYSTYWILWWHSFAGGWNI